MNREDIVRVLEESWKEVPTALERGLLNSERALQAFLYSRILMQRNFDGRIAIEPAWKTRFGEFIPDMVLWSSPSQIDAIVELKFVPAGYPVWQGDLEKLQLLQNELVLSDPQLNFPIFDTGINGYRQTAIHLKTIFVFAVVGKADSEAVDKFDVLGRVKSASFQDSFVHLPAKFPIAV